MYRMSHIINRAASVKRNTSHRTDIPSVKKKKKEEKLWFYKMRFWSPQITQLVRNFCPIRTAPGDLGATSCRRPRARLSAGVSKVLSLPWDSHQGGQTLKSCCPNTAGWLEELKVFMAMSSCCPFVPSLTAPFGCQHFYVFLFAGFYEERTSKQ